MGKRGVDAVLAKRASDRQRASSLACGLGVPVCLDPDELGPETTLLVVGAEGLSLEWDGMVLRGDFSRMARRLRPSGLSHELLVRAARVRGHRQVAPSRGETPEPSSRIGAGSRVPWAIDATAGMGEDSLLLAAAGFSVDLYERDPVIAALLRDALERAAEDPLLAGAIGRMRLHEEDSVPVLEGLACTGHSVGRGPGGPTLSPPDVVFLDPMFPTRQKSASAKKKLRMIQRLEEPCDAEGRLVGAALAAGPRKVVVKRPLKGPCLGGVKPAYALAGKAVRYDCLIPASMRYDLHNISSK